MANTVIISGRIGAEIRLSSSGKMAFATLAVDDKFKGQDGKKTTSWVNLKFIGEKKAQNAEKYLGKGTKIIVTGSLDFKKEKDKDSNYKEYNYVLVDEYEYCESKNASSNNSAPAPTDSDGFMSVPTGVDDFVPFA